jgi:RHS repeat-associated protein
VDDPGSAYAGNNIKDPLANRGYTGHEMLDTAGLVHMNGRVFDPQLARFASADPFIQTAEASESYNRYSYVMNNPLTMSDPSGYWSLGGFFRSIFHGIGNFLSDLGHGIAHFAQQIWNHRREVIAIAAVYFIGVNWMLLGNGGIFGAASTIANGVAAGFVGGAIQGGNLRSAIVGGVAGGLFAWVGGFKPSGWVGSLEKAAMHAVVGGATSVLAGGSFRSGALSAGLAELAGPYYMESNDVGSIIQHSIVGGVASQLSGGKFANGAWTAAYAAILNGLSSHEKSVVGQRQLEADLASEGKVVLGREISVRTDFANVRPDAYYYDPATEKFYLAEVKNGPNADFTDNQRLGYLAVDRGEWVPYGENARLAGLVPGELRGGLSKAQWGGIDIRHYHSPRSEGSWIDWLIPSKKPLH